MSALSLSSNLWSLVGRLAPFLLWLPRAVRGPLRPDLEAGLVGAVLILPQSFALATLAGMPPEYGVYASIVPVVVAALWGSSWHTLSGPNTALCVLIAGSVAPFASPGSTDYVGYVLALTLMVGVVQFALGLLRLGTVLDFISYTVIDALVLAVGLVIVVSAGAPLLGVLANLDEPFFYRVYQLAHDLERANPYAVAVGVATVAAGLAARRWVRRYALVVAVLVGGLAGYALEVLLGSAGTGIDLLGRLDLSALPLSMPHLSLESMAVLKQLLSAAFAIAFLGLMQTVVIARSLAVKSGQVIDGNQEIVAQGLSNLVAPFFSSFACSGSFNRSAAHYEAGARTPLAAVHASVLLALLVWLGGPLIAHLPMPAVAGALILVGLGLIEPATLRRALRQRRERPVFLATVAAALLFGLNAGVFTGLALSLVLYLWQASTPNLVVRRHFAADGRPVHAVTINGNLFFGSVHHVERALRRVAEGEEEPGVLLVHTEHLSYLDTSGIAMLAGEARRRRAAGGDCYLYLTRGEVEVAIADSGYLAELGADHLIHRDHDHPLKALLLPPRLPTARAARPDLLPARLRQALAQAAPGRVGATAELAAALAEHLAGSRLLGGVPEPALRRLLESGELCAAAAAGEEVAVAAGDCLVVLEGELELTRYWSAGQEVERHYRRVVGAAEEQGVVLLSGAAAERVVAQAVSPLRYLRLAGDAVDAALGASQQLYDLGEHGLLQHLGVFQHLPLENLREAWRRMVVREVPAGELVVHQGDEGDAYYVIESGEAEVSMAEVAGQSGHTVAHLGPGGAFGEEALLQGLPRNATVRMVTPGRLRVLAKADFDALVMAPIVDEIEPAAARRLVEQGRARWIDCRYELEYRQGHLPGARCLPLHELRGAAGELDHELTYIVYSRRSRRAAAAAFLLRERHLRAVVLTGGVRGWPYELEMGRAAA